MDKSSNQQSPSSTDPSPSISRKRSFPAMRLQNEPYSMEKRPTFGQWLKITWPDLVTILIVGAFALTTFRIGPPIANRTFPLTVIATNEVVYPQFAYPNRGQIVSPGLDTLLAILIPVAFIFLAQIRIRSFWDLNNALIGLTYALLVSSAFQVMIKWTIGGLRPNFYDTCKPDITRALSGEHDKTGLNGVGYHQYMWSMDICTTKDIGTLRNALQSFPSGHSTTIMAAAAYLFLYLNAKLKVFANHHSPMWKLVLLYCPILGAVLVCGCLTIDQSHNWYDILAGAIIGIVFAFSAYRMVYASIFDWRFNHIPLNRCSPFAGFDEYENYDRRDLVWTGRAGWRDGVDRESENTSLPPPVTSSESIRDRNGDDNIATAS
ncbi:acid phosphatase/Vanadium-dependent haloperoxidase [Biscogniauxia marginata]|nr:acid phosphatase/Vanadium-dependent haloperoxidase [Biscogniauxia marginata]